VGLGGPKKEGGLFGATPSASSKNSAFGGGFEKKEDNDSFNLLGGPKNPTTQENPLFSGSKTGGSQIDSLSIGKTTGLFDQKAPTKQEATTSIISKPGTDGTFLSKQSTLFPGGAAKDAKKPEEKKQDVSQTITEGKSPFLDGKGAGEKKDKPIIPQPLGPGLTGNQDADASKVPDLGFNKMAKATLFDKPDKIEETKGEAPKTSLKLDSKDTALFPTAPTSKNPPLLSISKEEEVKTEPKPLDLNNAMKKELTNKTIDDIFSTWNNQLETQTASFETSASKLNQAELELYENIDSLTVLQDTSKKVCDDYRKNLQDINHILEQQDGLAEYLNNMEKEVDQILQDKTYYSQLQGFGEMHDGSNKREAIYNQAIEANHNLDTIENVMKEISQKVCGVSD
jgi:hypothetical protein